MRAKPVGAAALLQLNRVVHEPARLAILTILAAAEQADFKFIQEATGLTKGNLNAHATKLEEAGYVTVLKCVRGKVLVTRYRLTAEGRRAIEQYRSNLFAGLLRSRR